VWGWLLGPFALAHYRVYRDAAMAQSFLEPLGKTICSRGLGMLGEVFGGDAPFPPGGCPAQAWSVAEVFRSWQFLGAEIAPLKASRKVVTADESGVIRNS
jgi:glycogen debranching enzyme